MAFNIVWYTNDQISCVYESDWWKLTQLKIMSKIKTQM